MNDSIAPQFAAALNTDLRAFVRICEEILLLARREHESLSGAGDYEHREFHQRRTELLPDIESLLRKFRAHRAAWQNLPQSTRDRFEDLKRMFQNVQNLVMRVMVLDRENQQAMLKRGMVPVQHIPPAAARQPHYVADLYRKNTLSGKQMNLFPSAHEELSSNG
jgi:hypothetical protein